MSQNKEYSAMKWFSNLEEGHVLSRGTIDKYTWMFDFDYTGVTSFDELNRFTIASKGELDKETKTLVNPIKLKPVLAPMDEAERAAKSASFFNTINTQMFSDVRKGIEYAINGLASNTSAPSVFFNIGNGKSNTLNSFTVDDFVGSKLHEDMIQKSFLGTKDDIVFDPSSKLYVHKRQLIPEAIGEATEEAKEVTVLEWSPGEDKHKRFLEKLDRMQSNSPSMDGELSSAMEEFLETISFKEAHQIETMSPEKVKKKYPLVRNMIEAVELTDEEIGRIENEVTKILGVEASQDEKDKLKEKIKAERTAEKQNKELESLKSNITFLHSDRRENIGTRENISREDQLEDLHKSMSEHRKQQEEDLRYLDRLRAATHKEDANGNWIQNDRLPNRNVDRLRQAIAVDMNPTTDSSGIAESIRRTIQAGRENYQYAKDNYEAVKKKSAELGVKYNSDFQKSFNKAKTLEEMEALATEKVEQYRLWSKSAASIMQWKDRREVDYILGEGINDTEYIKMYTMSKRLEAFHSYGDNSKVQAYYEQVFSEIEKSLKGNRDISKADITRLTEERIAGESEVAHANATARLLEDLPSFQKEIEKAKAKYDALRNSGYADVKEISKAKEKHKESVRSREENIARIFRENLEHLQPVVENDSYELLSSFVKRSQYAEELIAKQNNVSVSYLRMTNDEVEHVATYQKLRTEIISLDEQINSGSLTDEELEKVKNRRDNTSLHINAILEDLGAQSLFEEKKEFEARYREFKEANEEKQRLEKALIDKGYDSEFSKTVYDNETGKLIQVGVSKETYDRYVENPDALLKDMDGYNEEIAFARENKQLKNRQSWQRALAEKTIVKGSYNDELGYVVSEINPDTGIAYISRPTVSIQSLKYSVDISNQEFLSNIKEANVLMEAHMVDDYQPVVDHKHALSAFEDIDKGYISVVAKLPTIERMEEAVSPEDLLKTRQRITRYLLNDGNVKNSGLPQSITSKLDDFIQSQFESISNAENNIELVREDIDKLIESKADPSLIEEKKQLIQSLQIDLSTIRASQGDLRNKAVESVLVDFETSQVNKIVKRNERIEREIALFGFEQGKDEANIKLSRQQFTEIMIGKEGRTNRFYEDLISSHLPHLRNSKEVLTSSVGEAIMEVINDHVSQHTDFDLRDDNMVRRYMRALSSDALTPDDLSDENKGKLKRYQESLGEKTMTARLQDFLFSDIVQKSAQISGSDSSGVDHVVKAVYREMALQGSEADITGQSLYSFIHNTNSASNADLKRTYQSRILGYSPEQLNTMLMELRSPRNVSLDRVTVIDSKAAESIDTILNDMVTDGLIENDNQMVDDLLREGMADRETADQMRRTSVDRNAFYYHHIEPIADDIERLGLDLSDLKKMDLEKSWNRMARKHPHMVDVRGMVLDSAEVIRDSIGQVDVMSEDELYKLEFHKQRVSRLSLYALGVGSGKEEKYRSILRAEDLNQLFPDVDLMKGVFENKESMDERQLAAAMHLSDSVGKRVEVKIPIEDNGTVDGYLRFSEAGHIEAYSPSLNQSFVVNKRGVSKTATINTADVGAYSTENRMHSMTQHSKTEPILKYSLANEGQVKRFGQATVLSNVDASIGNLVDFVEQNKVAISYDIETSTTNPKKIGIAVQPIEIFAQQIQLDKETGELLTDDMGRFGVMDSKLVEVTNPDGSVEVQNKEIVRAKEFHAIVELDTPTLSIIEKAAANPDYFNVNTGGAMKIHVASYQDAIMSADQGLSKIDFVKHVTGNTVSKNKAGKILNELLTKSEEFRLLQNVAKYKFGADKSAEDIERFGTYSDGKAVDGSGTFKSFLKDSDRKTYNEIFDDAGVLRTEDNIIQFNRELYEHQSKQTAVLVEDAMQAAKNLADKDFDYGIGIKRYSVGDALEAFNSFVSKSNAEIIVGQNVEKADNKTLIQAGKNVDNKTAKMIETNEAYAPLKKEIDKVIKMRDELFQKTLGSITNEYSGRFGVNPVVAAEQRELLETPKFLMQDAEGKFKTPPKTWVKNVSDALELITDHTGTTMKFSSDEITKADESIRIMTNIIDGLQGESPSLTDVDLAYAKDIGVFNGDEHTIKSHLFRAPVLEDRTKELFEGMGVVDQQIISRLVNASLTSQSNEAVMSFYGHDSTMAHDGKVDTNFSTSVVGKFAKMVHDHVNGIVTADNAAISEVISGMDVGKGLGGSFMERNAYVGDGSEYVAFIQSPGKDVQKGVYRLTGFNEERTTAYLQRAALGADGVIDDTSVKVTELPATTSSELAHKFAQTVRFVENDNVVGEIESYIDDISDRHFKKILNSDFSYDSHMNQIREMELEGFRENPLFNTQVRLLDANVDEIIQVAGADGKVELKTNPIERARQEYAESFNTTPVTITEEMKAAQRARNAELEKAGKDLEIPEFELEAKVDDVTGSTIGRTLLRNGGKIGDKSEEKFYNKKLSKEQILSLQEMNDFNHTSLGVHVSDMMDNLSALQYQGNVTPAEKANILSAWNEELKEIAKEEGFIRKVRNAYEFPEFMINVEDKLTGGSDKHLISGTIQTGSATEVANSLKGMANKILEHIDYENDESITGLKEDRAINAKILPELRKLGIIGEDEFRQGDKNVFVGLGELSQTVFNRLTQQDPANPLLQNVTAVDYMKLANGLSNEGLERLEAKTTSLLEEGFSRQTDIQALQFKGLINSRQEMKDAGMYIPGMKLNTGTYSEEDVDLSKRYSSGSFLKRLSIDELVKTADFISGSARDIDKDVTELVYKEIAGRAFYNPNGKNSIKPEDIIASGDTERIKAATALNWVEPFRDSEVIYKPTPTHERRMAYGQYAGTKLGDMSERILNSQSGYALSNMKKPDYETLLSRNAYMQQQQEILEWRNKDYEGYDFDKPKYNTARGEAPRSFISSVANEQIKEEYGNERRNPTPEPMSEPAQPDSSTKYFMSDPERAKKYLQIQEPVTSEDLMMRQAAEKEIVAPTPERTSPLGDFITERRQDMKDILGDQLSDGTGKKWIAGLGIAAAALFTVNAMTSPMKLETRPAGHGVQGVTGTPEDDNDRSNKQAENRGSLQTPQVNTGGTSYVSSGDKGYTIKAKGKAPSNIDSSQLQSTINGSMEGASNVNINLRDDRSTLDSGWLESQFSNFIERGSV